MLKILSKLKEKQGTALVTAIALLCFLTIMSVCFTLAVNTTRKADESSRELEQGTLFAKAGLNMTIEALIAKFDEVVDPSGDDISFVKFLENALANKATFKITGKVTDINPQQYTQADGSLADYSEAECPPIDFYPDFTVTIDASGSDSNKIIKLISTVNYLGHDYTAERFFYYTTTKAVKVPSDAVNSSGSINGTFSINGRLRGQNLDLGGGSDYDSVYATNNLLLHNSGLRVVRTYTAVVDAGGNITGYKFADESHKGDILSSGNFTGPLAMVIRKVTPTGTTEGGRYNAADFDSAEFKDFTTGKVAAKGYVFVNTATGASAPEYIHAFGAATVPTNADQYDKVIDTTRNFALCYSAFSSQRIGAESSATGEGSFKTVVYSNGNAYIHASGKACDIYGNVVVKGDFVVPQGPLTVHGNVFVKGCISANFNNSVVAETVDGYGGRIVAKDATDGKYYLWADAKNKMKDASNMPIQVSISDFDQYVTDLGGVIPTTGDILDEELGTTSSSLGEATFPEFSQAYSSSMSISHENYNKAQKNIEDFVLSDDKTELRNDGISVHARAYTGVFTVIHVNQDTYIKGGADELYANVGEHSVKAQWDKTAESVSNCNWVFYNSLFIDASQFEPKDASKGDLDENGMLDVVIEGDWTFGSKDSYLDGNRPFARLFVNDHNHSVIVRLFLKNKSTGEVAKLNMYTGQVYVPDSAASTIVAQNFSNPPLTGDLGDNCVAENTLMAAAGALFENADNTGEINGGYAHTPKLFVFSENNAEIQVLKMGTMHAFVLAPLAKFKIDNTKTYRFFGKLLLKEFDFGSILNNIVYYIPPAEADQNAAVSNVFASTTSGSATVTMGEFYD